MLTDLSRRRASNPIFGTSSSIHPFLAWNAPTQVLQLPQHEHQKSDMKHGERKLDESTRLVRDMMLLTCWQYMQTFVELELLLIMKNQTSLVVESLSFQKNKIWRQMGKSRAWYKKIGPQLRDFDGLNSREETIPTLAR